MAVGDLTTRADVREFLMKNNADTAQDDVIDRLITAASRLFSRECQREFVPTDGATRVFSWDGSAQLDLAPYDLRSPAPTILLDADDDDSTQLTVDEYRLRPLPASDGVFQRIILNPRRMSSGRWPDRVVSVEGDWGFASVPSDVGQAVVLTVAIWLRRDVAAFESTFSLDEDRVERPKTLPSAVSAVVEGYRRWTV